LGKSRLRRFCRTLLRGPPAKSAVFAGYATLLAIGAKVACGALAGQLRLLQELLACLVDVVCDLLRRPITWKDHQVRLL
jgi:hypothetical protein